GCGLGSGTIPYTTLFRSWAGCETRSGLIIMFKEVRSIMAKCAICEKGAHFGNNVSHSHRRTNKMWKSNIKSVRVKVNGATKKMYVCTSCLKSGRVERA